MNHSAECSKVMETGGEGCIDRISSLPDELLVHILSSLSTLSAPQTNLLSSRWRYLSTFISNLSFDDRAYFRIHRRSWKDVDEAIKTNFKSFVNGVLASCKISPIEKLSLKSAHAVEDDCSHIREWISTAILKNVRHLHLKIYYQSNLIPDCDFNSETLEVLEVTYYGYLVVPELVFLPNLTTLKLCWINFSDDDSAKRLIVGCPQLKELNLISCIFRGQSRDRVYISAESLQSLRISWCKGHAGICAPNLVNFKYEWHYSVDIGVSPSLEIPCSLDKAEFCFYGCTSMYKLPKVVLDIITGAALHVRELCLMGNMGWSLQLFSKVKEDQIMSYSKLGSLRLGSCDHNTWKYMAFLVANSPQLETIIFKEGLLDNDAMHEWYPDTELAPFSSNVKTIEVHHFGGSKPELLLLKYLLENARALKRLIIHIHQTVTMEEELEISKEVSMFLNASTDFSLRWETGFKFRKLTRKERKELRRKKEALKEKGKRIGN